MAQMVEEHKSRLPKDSLVPLLVPLAQILVRLLVEGRLYRRLIPFWDCPSR